MEELNDKDARLKRETTRAKRGLQRERQKKEEARLTALNESKKQRNHRMSGNIMDTTSNEINGWEKNKKIARCETWDVEHQLHEDEPTARADSTDELSFNSQKPFKTFKVMRSTEKDKNTWKSKYYRAIPKIEKVDPVMSSVQEIMRKGPKAVRRKLIEGEVSKSQIIQNKKRLSDESQKSLHAQVVAGPLIEEYGCKNEQAQLVIDFSQNYIGKRDKEIHDAHFGASQKQLSLHTGVFYYKNKNEEIVCVSFCTVSENLSHDAAAIWAHLKPVLELIKDTIPDIQEVHVRSDGPTTQYKNKTNFFLFHHFCKELGLRRGSWNFSTPGHGKSSADAIGGTVKSLCDQYVLTGHDVMTVDDVIKAVGNSDSRIHIIPITSTDMEIVGLITSHWKVTSVTDTSCKVTPIQLISTNHDSLMNSIHFTLLYSGSTPATH
ncbi:hypothetical protein QAD02_014528 [Eretmocerus hayati]|uniref:Uncharacterized protein n=1 Tax=Eretmocerus hayati TaxID=131215 RepID=A0ACC2P5L9_9HYME|nr:hypothetical protein QAD02_014528 [Eretmocerus hayati]